MKKIILSTLAAASLFAAGYESNEPNSWTSTEYVKVSRSEPIYRQVTASKPVRECWDEDVAVQSGGGGGNDIIGGLVGGAIGGALGNQVGRGSGKTAATIGGAIVGSMIGQGASRGNEQTSSVQTVRKCRNRNETSTENRLTGYNNYGTYKGRQIVKFSDAPLESIAIYTTISY